MDRLTARTKLSFAIRGVIAVVVATAAATFMVLHGSGSLEKTNDISVAVPATAGLITGEAPVRYHGVNIGRIGKIESGTTESVVQLQIDPEASEKIPATVIARVVPRTFFGDIYMQLVDNPEATGTAKLADAGEISMDTGPEAVALYDVYTKLVGVLNAMQPEKLHTALTSLGQALDGKGAEIGDMIDNLSSASTVLSPAAQQFLDATPELRDVVESMNRATPDIIDTLASATSVSNSMVANSAGFEASIGAAALFAGTVGSFVAENNADIITVTDSFGKILATTADNPAGLRSTLANASTFGEAGARVFSTGKFNITAVATFVDPLPYTGSDCPQYAGQLGSQCHGSNLQPTPSVTAVSASPIVGGADEASTLRYLEDQLLGEGVSQTIAPNPATTLMLGPLVRGNEVTVP